MLLNIFTHVDCTWNLRLHYVLLTGWKMLSFNCAVLNFTPLLFGDHVSERERRKSTIAYNQTNVHNIGNVSQYGCSLTKHIKPMYTMLSTSVSMVTY